MIVKEVTNILEALAPLEYAEDFDNVGLLVGDSQSQLTGILVTLDTLEHVVDEAIAKNCNLIISFHPIIFSGLKKITGRTYVERVVLKAIQHGISIYCMHTALDNAQEGVNAKICEILGLQKTSILIPKKQTIKKLTTYVPIAHSEDLKQALYASGAGDIGNYSNCSFELEGIGNFIGDANSAPTVGKPGKKQIEKETQIHIIFDKHKEAKILEALFQNHPYEEVAYEITTLDNLNQTRGMGMVGELENAMDAPDFMDFLKEKMHASVIKHSALLDKPIKRVAVLGGSGSFAIEAAKACKADILVTADLKYHQFYQAEGLLILADIGHYESEQFTKNLIADYLTKKIPNFAISLSEDSTNPINYF